MLPKNIKKKEKTLINQGFWSMENRGARTPDLNAASEALSHYSWKHYPKILSKRQLVYYQKSKFKQNKKRHLCRLCLWSVGDSNP